MSDDLPVESEVRPQLTTLVDMTPGAVQTKRRGGGTVRSRTREVIEALRGHVAQLRKQNFVL